MLSIPGKEEQKKLAVRHSLWYSSRTMAITKSAKRAKRVSDKRAVVNSKRVRTMKDSVKTVRKSISTASASTQEDLRLAFKALDKAAKRGVIKKGTADRKKSRLAKAVAKVK